jgi:hypothetical protein
MGCPCDCATSTPDEAIPVRDGLAYLPKEVVRAMVTEVSKALSQDGCGLVEGAERANVGSEATSPLTDHD